MGQPGGDHRIGVDTGTDTELGAGHELKPQNLVAGAVAGYLRA